MPQSNTNFRMSRKDLQPIAVLSKDCYIREIHARKRTAIEQKALSALLATGSESESDTQALIALFNVDVDREHVLRQQLTEVLQGLLADDAYSGNTRDNGRWSVWSRNGTQVRDEYAPVSAAIEAIRQKVQQDTVPTAAEAKQLLQQLQTAWDAYAVLVDSITDGSYRKPAAPQAPATAKEAQPAS